MFDGIFYVSCFASIIGLVLQTGSAFMSCESKLNCFFGLIPAFQFIAIVYIVLIQSSWGNDHVALVIVLLLPVHTRVACE